MKIICFISIIMLLSGGCEENPTSSVYSSEYQLWRSHNIHDYTIDQIISCFCINGGQKMRVTVQSDTIFLVTRLSDSAVMPYSYFKQYLTIDSLFGIIQNSRFDSIVVAYDPEFGYPAKLDINPQLHPVDGGVMYLSSNLQIIRK